MASAKYVCRLTNRYNNRVTLVYSYKGYEYSVEDHRNGLNDLREQHEYEQHLIDKKIERKANYTITPATFDIEEVFKLLELEQ